MLLATQCPHCFTSFRVANDQLKLHAGLVRCGACQQTFNGIEYLLAPGAKPALPPTAATAVTSVIASHTADIALQATSTPIQVAIPEAHHTAEPEIVASFVSVENASITNGTANSEQEQYLSVETSSNNPLDFDLGEDAIFAPVAAVEINIASETEFEVADDVEDIQADLLTKIPLINEESGDHTAAEFQPESTRQEHERDLNDKPDAVANIEEETLEENINVEKPDFVIQAEKKQGRSRLVRISMIIMATLLFVALLAQVTYSLKNQISAWFPQSKSLLQEACKHLRCRIELPTQREVISIESHELQTLSGDQNILSLAIQLQNKSDTLQAWPMLELILNDAKDKPVLRRVFTPAEYLAIKNDLLKGFSAKSEQSISLYFELSGTKAAGYQVDVFYP